MGALSLRPRRGRRRTDGHLKSSPSGVQAFQIDEPQGTITAPGATSPDSFMLEAWPLSSAGREIVLLSVLRRTRSKPPVQDIDGVGQGAGGQSQAVCVPTRRCMHTGTREPCAVSGVYGQQCTHLSSPVSPAVRREIPLPVPAEGVFDLYTGQRVSWSTTAASATQLPWISVVGASTPPAYSRWP